MVRYRSTPVPLTGDDRRGLFESPLSACGSGVIFRELPASASTGPDSLGGYPPLLGSFTAFALYEYHGWWPKSRCARSCNYPLSTGADLPVPGFFPLRAPLLRYFPVHLGVGLVATDEVLSQALSFDFIDSSRCSHSHEAALHGLVHGPVVPGPWTFSP